MSTTTCFATDKWSELRQRKDEYKTRPTYSHAHLSVQQVTPRIMAYGDNRVRYQNTVVYTAVLCRVM